MIQKKICLLGSFSVGKTSLIQQYVNSIFDDKYLTTIGVKVDKKQFQVDDQDVMLMIWDLAGEDDYNSLKTSYLRGAAGYIIVMDGTRPKSFDIAQEIQKLAQDTLGDVPFVTAVNKADLSDQWQISEEQLGSLPGHFNLLKTSAKTGENVETLFSSLARKML